MEINLCAECFTEKPLIDSGCDEKPEERIGEPIGMYHCPDCGMMLVSGFSHPKVCQECKHGIEH